MKRFFIMLAAAAIGACVLTSCGETKAPGYSIEFKNPVQEDIYLSCITVDGMDRNLLDTLKAEGNIVKFDLAKFATSNAEVYAILCPRRLPVYFLPEDGGITFIESDPKEGEEMTYLNMATNKLSDDNKTINDFNKRIVDLRQLDMKMRAKLPEADSIQAMKLFEESKEYNEAFNNTIVKIITDNPSSKAANALLMLNSDLFIDSIPAFEAIEGKLQKGTVHDMLTKKVASKKAIQVGKQFTDVVLPTPDGKELKLSEFAGKGKPVLLDFWASWCPPCRKENPRFVEIYKKYRPKGFDIFAVSLDNDANAWKKAIEDDQLTWHHVSKLNPRECEACNVYMINSIPSNVLIDGNGIIVGHNLMGEDLERELDKLFAK